MDIFNIEISVLLSQYLDFMQNCHENGFEISGDFLEMTAHLIYIKTASLLPESDTAEMLKTELQNSLIEYSICKSVADNLSKLYTDNIFTHPPFRIKADKSYKSIHSPDVLADVLGNLDLKKFSPEITEYKIENKINSVVKHRIVPVIRKVVHILRQLYSTGSVDIDSLYTGINNRSERVAVFLAVLELTRSGRICISDDNEKIFMKDGEKNWKPKRKKLL